MKYTGNFETDLIAYTSSRQLEPQKPPLDADNFSHQIIPMSLEIKEQIATAYIMIEEESGLKWQFQGNRAPNSSGAFVIDTMGSGTKMSITFIDKHGEDLLRVDIDPALNDNGDYIILIPFQQETTLTQLKNPTWNLISERIYPDWQIDTPFYKSSESVWVTVERADKTRYVTQASLIYSQSDGFKWDCSYDSSNIADDSEVIAWCNIVDSDPRPYEGKL